MQMWDEIDKAKAMAEAGRELAAQASQDVDALRAAMVEVQAAIKNLPAPRTFTVRIRDVAHTISEREALTWTAGFAVSLMTRQPVRIRLGGDAQELMDGDIIMVMHQILAQAEG